MIVENNIRFRDTINKISEAESSDALRNIIVAMCKTFDLANIVYHAVYIPESPAFHPILILTYNSDWIERNKNNDYFKIDPVVNSGTKSFLPLDWSVLDREGKSVVNFFGKLTAMAWSVKA